MAAVFDNVGIHEARNNPLTDQRLRNPLGELRSRIRGILFLARHARRNMLAGVCFRAARPASKRKGPRTPWGPGFLFLWTGRKRSRSVPAHFLVRLSESLGEYLGQRVSASVPARLAALSLPPGARVPGLRRVCAHR